MRWRGARQGAAVSLGLCALLAVTGTSPASGVVVVGTDGDDVLTGGRGADVLRGGHGHDGLWSHHRGRDRLLAGGQSDDVGVSAGHAFVRGGPGADRLYLAGDATGVLDGDAGDDVMAARDAARGVLRGGAGDDRLESLSFASPRLRGGQGDDELEVTGTTGGVRGGAGDDLVILHEYAGGRATGPIAGGEGDDDLFVQNGFADDVWCGPGRDLARIDIADDVVGCEVVEHRISGHSADDILVGSSYDDIVDGFGGDDQLDGDAGDDTFYAGRGQDLVLAGPGDDEVYVWEAGEAPEADQVSCGAGVDTVYADAEDLVGADCENVSILALPPAPDVVLRAA